MAVKNFPCTSVRTRRERGGYHNVDIVTGFIYRRDLVAYDDFQSFLLS